MSSHHLRHAALVLSASALLIGPARAEDDAKPVPAPQAEPAKPDAKSADDKAPAADAKAGDAKADEAKGDTPKMPVLLNPDNALGDFGSSEPIARADEPERGVIHFPITTSTLSNGEHWDQYNVPFKTHRWGKYRIRLTYSLSLASLGTQLLFDKGQPDEARFKKTLDGTGNAKRQVTLGTVYIPDAADHFMAFFTPQSVGFTSFVLHEICLVPTGEGSDVTQADNGDIELLAKDATTWSEHMRYEPKPEKNCLGFWTDPKDFAEWEIKVVKPGKFKVCVHQGSATGDSKVALQLGDQKLQFSVQNTGDFHKISEVPVGELEIKEPGTYHLAIKPETKNGSAIMDIQKVVLQPVS
jgi:hypothetical protein